MGRSDLIDKINARIKSQLSSPVGRPSGRSKPDDKDDKAGDGGEQRTTSKTGTVVIRRKQTTRPEDVVAAPSAPSPAVQSPAPEPIKATAVVRPATNRAEASPEPVKAPVEARANPARPASGSDSEVSSPVSSAGGDEAVQAASVSERTPVPVEGEKPAVQTAPPPAEDRKASSSSEEPIKAVAEPVKAEVQTAATGSAPAPTATAAATPAAEPKVAPVSTPGAVTPEVSKAPVSQALPVRSNAPIPQGGTGSASMATGSGDARPEPRRPGGSDHSGPSRGNERTGDGGGRSSSSSARLVSLPPTPVAQPAARDYRDRDGGGYRPRPPGQDRGGYEGRGGGEGRHQDYRGGTDRPGGYRSGSDRPSGPDRMGGDRYGADRPSQDRFSSDRSGPERYSERPGSDRYVDRPGDPRQTEARSGGDVRYGSGGYERTSTDRPAYRPAPSQPPPRPAPPSLDDVLEQELGHIPIVKRAMVVGEVRPQSHNAPPRRPPIQDVRGPAPQQRMERQAPAVVVAGEHEGVLELNEGGETDELGGAAARRTAGPAPSVKEIANEDRKREKTISRVAAGGRPGVGRPGAEEDARLAKAKKGTLKKKEIIQRRDVTGEGDVAFRKAKKSAFKKEKDKEKGKPKITVPKAAKRVIRIEDTITVSELSHRMGVKAPAVIKKLMAMGMMATINQAIDHDTASLLAAEFSYEVENVAFDEAAYLIEEADTEEDLVHRPPVVTIMGHVDHGKTTLLDAIRLSDVASGEAGGITQHIGAYKVATRHGGQVVFLDTPGHEAFTAMRARGAKITDVVVLVVAADDGVMPQTVEALNHAKAAKVPIVVAVNKIDKPGAQPERIMQKLMEYDLVPEEYGGQTIFAKVSAKQKIGIDSLLDLILLQAEVLELKANPNRAAKATVVEAKLDRGRGPVATVLVSTGTLRVGDIVVVGAQFGKVRAMLDDHGKPVKDAGPATPVEILGLSDVPDAGDVMVVVSDMERARQVVEKRVAKARDQAVTKSAKVSLEDLFNQMQKSDVKELKLVLKVDVHGSLEPLADAIRKLSTETVRTVVLHAGVGNISEGDVMLARASGAVVIGFNVRPDSNAAAVAEKEDVEIKTYSVIYEALDELRRAMLGLLKPVQQERVLGHALVKAIFNIPRFGVIAGCLIQDGKVNRGCSIRVQRAGKVVWDGKLGSLRRGKDDVKEVEKGFECGIALDGFNEAAEGDILEAYQVDEIAPTL